MCVDVIACQSSLSVNQNIISISTSVTKPVWNFRGVCANVLPDVGSVEGLAYHRAWDTLYWTSSTTSTISRHTLDQSRVGAFAKQSVVTLSEDDHPHTVALDECQRSAYLSSITFDTGFRIWFRGLKPAFKSLYKFTELLLTLLTL